MSFYLITKSGKQLFVAQPNVYDSQLPDSFAHHFPDLANAVSRKSFPYKKKPTFSVIEIQSRKGQKFQTFFKHKMYGKGKEGWIQIKKKIVLFQSCTMIWLLPNFELLFM